MDLSQSFEAYKPFLKQYWLPIALALFGLIFLSYGLIALFGGSSSSTEVVFESGAPASESARLKEIIIDVSGAVVKPGVYHLNFDSRVQDALVAAGGLAGSADRNWVEKNLNLAVKLRDGGKIYIPHEGESRIREYAGRRDWGYLRTN